MRTRWWRIGVLAGLSFGLWIEPIRQTPRVSWSPVESTALRPVNAPRNRPQHSPHNEFASNLSRDRSVSPSLSSGLIRPDVVRESRFALFHSWFERYEIADPIEKVRLEPEGVLLAKRRLEEMEDLIPSDPKRAIELSVPMWVRTALPEAVRELLEEPFSARAHLMVRASLPLPGDEDSSPRVERILELGEMIYSAHVYGRRSGEPSRSDVPLHGILLGGQAAIHESPVRIASAEESAFLRAASGSDPICSVTGQLSAVVDSGRFLEVAGETSFVCGTRHAEHVVGEALAREGLSMGRASEGPVLAPSAYTEGVKNLILIRVDFDDLAGIPFTDSQAESVVNGLDAFFAENSFGRAGFRKIGDGSDVTPALRMPRTSTWYGTNDASRLRTDARAAARAAGYDLTKFNFDIIWFKKVSGFRWSGLGFIGSPGAWVQDTASVGVAAHELGHNYGLEHANFWDTSGETIIGSGTAVEYGDKFDTMGSANAGSKHFNVRYKNLLNWIPSTDVVVPATNGVYRLFPHDDPEASGPRAIRLRKNASTNYWIELRQRYAGNKWLADGVTLRWSGTGGQATRLLDMTPGTVPGKDDAALLIGRTFSDPAANLHITPLGKNGTTPESVDVAILQGPFPGNRVPSVQLTASSVSAAVGAEIRFAAEASDADGDALAYFWDFGDSDFAGNRSVSAHRWSAAGEYVVRCEVSDMKGGRASARAVVRVGNPSTFRISGRIITLEGTPVEGVRLSASSTQMTWSDSDGRFDLTGLVAGTYSLKATFPQYAFQPVGQGITIGVGPSKQNIDFIAIPPSGIVTEPLVTAGSVWQYLDDGTNLGTEWRTSGFDDSAWKEGAAPLGYGDDNERTAIGFGPSSSSKYVTTYFRRSFTVGSGQTFSAVTLGVRRDDGAVVYLDGREVFRSNLPSGTISSTTLASNTVGGTDEQAFFNAQITPGLLTPGTHILAVEVHQSSRSSSDLVFDLELLASSLPAPSPPSLAVEFAGQDLRVSWPDTPRPWHLQEADSLGGKSSWNPTRLIPSVAGGRKVVVLPRPQASRFYRLSDQAALSAVESRSDR